MIHEKALPRLTDELKGRILRGDFYLDGHLEDPLEGEIPEVSVPVDLKIELTPTGNTTGDGKPANVFLTIKGLHPKTEIELLDFGTYLVDIMGGSITLMGEPLKWPVKMK